MNGTVAEYAIYKSGDIPIWQTISDDVVVNAIIFIGFYLALDLV